MPETSLTISLPEALKAHVLERVAEGAFSDAGDHVRALIRADMGHCDEELEALLRRER